MAMVLSRKRNCSMAQKKTLLPPFVPKDLTEYLQLMLMVYLLVAWSL